MKRVYAFTDGAASNNQNASERHGGWAVVLMAVDAHNQRDPRPQAYKEVSGSVAGATNNQMELEAVRQALLALTCDGVHLTIVTDSNYVIGILSKGWKARTNTDLVADIQRLMTRHRVSFVKVSGHSGNRYNDRADTLAKAAARA